jgi:hypothetical protein
MDTRSGIQRSFLLSAKEMTAHTNNGAGRCHVFRPLLSEAGVERLCKSLKNSMVSVHRLFLLKLLPGSAAFVLNATNLRTIPELHTHLLFHQRLIPSQGISNSSFEKKT